MNEKDFINLLRDVERHEDAVVEDAKEIRRLNVDVWELSNLVRLLAAFVPRPVSGMLALDSVQGQSFLPRKCTRQ